MAVYERQLAIVRRGENYISAALEGQALDNVIAEPASEKALRVGDIYIGRVDHIVKNINAAFVEVQKGIMCYVPLGGCSGQKIVQGQELAVQVKKAAVKTKRAVASCSLEFAGTYAVVTSGNRTKSISAKISDAEVRDHLEELLPAFGDVPLGIILRTSCQDAADEQILAECSQLLRLAEDVMQRTRTRARFTKLYRAEMEVVKFLRGTGGGMFDRIVTDERPVYDQLMETEELSAENIVFYDDPSYPLDKLLGIGQKLERALSRHVWLKSGASLVIEPTEALTVIDVNTERAVGGKRSSESTFFKINMEAAKEAARQIRVRNISGIILIDFIDMREREHVKALLRELENEFKRDSVRTTVVDMTKLGLVEITRMKLRKPLWEMVRRGEGSRENS